MEIKKITLVLFLFAFFSISCTDLPKNPRSVPALSGLNAQGENYSFVFKNCKSTIITFGASFCPPCKIDHKILSSHYSDLTKDSLCVLYINADESLEIMANYLEKEHIPYPAIHWNYELMNNLGNPYLLPTYFVANQNGDIQVYQKGLLGQTGYKKLIEKIKLNLQEKE